MKRLVAVASVLGLAVLISACTTGETDGARAETPGQVRYAVPFTCGDSSGGSSSRTIAGQYATVVQVQNPSATDQRPVFGVTLTLPPGQGGAGITSGFSGITLRPDQALELDCRQIINDYLSNPPTDALVAGYLLIGSAVPLNVAATYTTGSGGSVVDMQVTRIEPES